MRRTIQLAVALVLAAVSSGCLHGTGFGFRADGPELPRLKQVLSLEPGRVIADFGAGQGELTVALAREVGAHGQVFATEIDPDRRQRLRELVAAAKLANVTVIEARSDASDLPSDCCDAIVMRRVYHHLTAVASVNADLLRALRPGGVLAVIDFPPPPLFGRSLLGVSALTVTEELTRAGFELIQALDDWPGRGPLSSYCLVFRKPQG